MGFFAEICEVTHENSQIHNTLYLIKASFEALTCIATWALVWMLLGSPLSLPQLHLTVCPATSVLCVATIACAADSFVENLKQIKCYK